MLWKQIGKLQIYGRAYCTTAGDGSGSLLYRGAYARFPASAYEGVKDAVDWRTEGAVTRVKRQGRLNTCWAFGALGSVEGIHKLATGELIDLSAQELADCITPATYKICGGTTGSVFNYIIANNGISTEEEYPYTYAYGNCDYQKKHKKVVTIDDYYKVPCDERSLQLAVSFQPITVSIKQEPLDTYIDGILKIEDGYEIRDLNHAVLVVGYGTDDMGTDYWILKNSYGEEWGENGYFRIQRNVKWAGGGLGITLNAFGPMKNEVKLPCVPDVASFI